MNNKLKVKCWMHFLNIFEDLKYTHAYCVSHLVLKREWLQISFHKSWEIYFFNIYSLKL